MFPCEYFLNMVTVGGESKIEIFKCNIKVVAYSWKSGKFANLKFSWLNCPEFTNSIPSFIQIKNIIVFRCLTIPKYIFKNLRKKNTHYENLWWHCPYPQDVKFKAHLRWNVISFTTKTPLTNCCSINMTVQNIIVNNVRGGDLATELAIIASNAYLFWLL